MDKRIIEQLLRTVDALGQQAHQIHNKIYRAGMTGLTDVGRLELSDALILASAQCETLIEIREQLAEIQLGLELLTHRDLGE